MGFFRSGKQICCLCSVVSAPLWDPLKTSLHSGLTLYSSVSLTRVRHSPPLVPLLFPAFAFLGLLWNQQPPCIIYYHCNSLLLCLWSCRPSFPSELASLNILFWFVCDTLPAAGLSSRTPKDAFLGQHPVFVKLLCRETAVKEGCLAQVSGSKVLTQCKSRIK